MHLMDHLVSMDMRLERKKSKLECYARNSAKHNLSRSLSHLSLSLPLPPFLPLLYLVLGGRLEEVRQLAIDL